MNVLITGVNGLLGNAVAKIAFRNNIHCIGLGRKTLNVQNNCEYYSADITNYSALEKIIKYCKPDTIIHCAAFTDVDLAEKKEYKNKVYEINVSGTKNIVDLCKKHSIKLIFISSDYVFSGDTDMPWKEDTIIEGKPKNSYGETKRIAERIIWSSLKRYYIVRTSWLFGEDKDNFVTNVINKILMCKEIFVLKNQIGTPTYTYDLASCLLSMAKTEKYGVYHVTNLGKYISKYEFALEINSYLERISDKNLRTKIVAVNSLDKKIYADRPSNCRLEMKNLANSGFKELPHWQESLHKFIDETVYKRVGVKYD